MRYINVRFTYLLKHSSKICGLRRARCIKCTEFNTAVHNIIENEAKQTRLMSFGLSEIKIYFRLL